MIAQDPSESNDKVRERIPFPQLFLLTLVS